MAARSRSGTIRQAIGPLRTRLTRYIQAAQNQLLSWQLTESVDQCNETNDAIFEMIGKIKSVIETINAKDTQWQTLMSGLGEADLEPEEELYNGVASDEQSGYLITVETAKELICSLERKSKAITRSIEHISSCDGDSGNVGQSTADGRQGSAKLPKLSLPIFDGNYLEWPNFWNIYKLNVHDRNNLASAEKFTYLRGLLGDTARGAIAGIPITDNNYDIAVKLLQTRYQRSETQIIGALYSQLKRLPVSGSRVAELIATFDSCEKIFRQLEAAGENTDANRSLVMDVLSKYPANVIKELTERYKVGVDSSVSELRTALQSYVKQSENLAEILEELDPFVSKPNERSSRNKSSPCPTVNRDDSDATKPVVPTSAFMTSDTKASANASPQNPCYFCGDRHYNSRCGKFGTAVDRVARLHQLNRCSKCLSSAHVVGKCKTPDARLKCFFCKSVGEHVSPLCPVEFGSKLKNKDGSDAGTSSNSALLNTHERAHLLTATTVVHNPEKSNQRSVRMLFDSGSHRSYITADCARLLSLSAACEEPLHVAIFGTTRSLSVKSSQVSVDVQLRNGTKVPIALHTTPIITNCSINSAELHIHDVTMIKSEGLQLADDIEAGHGGIDILIGSDYFWDFVTGTKRRTPSGIYLISSTLGYLVGGRYEQSSVTERRSQRDDAATLLCLTETQSAIPIESGLAALPSRGGSAYPDLEEYWSLESIGITDDPRVNDDDEALSQFNNSVEFREGRYHVKWPWKDTKDLLPTNFELALGRFKSLAKRLDAANSDVFTKYCAVINDQLAKGVIEKIDEDFEDYRSCPNTVHYLPHHPVVKPTSTTTKVRIVYDASAKSKKDTPSLNECLYRGPVLLPDLCHVLIRFRLRPIAIIADVEKAFLQMALHPSERDVTRFIWYADPFNPHINNLATYRFCRVPFGIISSPFLLGATCRYHLQQTNTNVSLAISKDMYVDNVASGVNTDSEAIKFYDEAKGIFESAGMNLQEWCSNSLSFQQAVPEADRTKERDVKVLGMRWDSDDDSLRLNCSWKIGGTTKREVLQAIASVYDPLGLFLPVLLKAKVFLHKLWDENRLWDEPLQPATADEWVLLQAEITPMMGIRIPRFVFPVNQRSDISIVGFSDASALAYAAVVYLRSFDITENRWTTALVYSKSRLSPSKRSKLTVSLPRLELLGLLIATRAALFVRAALQSESIPIYLFCDSMCVLHWINSSKPLSVFVENRIREMKAAVGVQFKFVPTSDNPADIASRGMTAEKLLSSAMWWQGPEFLQKNVQFWSNPVSNGIDADDIKAEVASETKKQPVFHTILAGEAAAVPPNVGLLGIDPTRYSSLRKLLGITVICLKFIRRSVWDNLTVDSRDSTSEHLRRLFDVSPASSSITFKDLQIAKDAWVQVVQQESFHDLITAIINGENHTLRKQLGVQLDRNGLLRCCGRFQHADLGAGTIQPKLLPGRAHLTNLIITDIHKRQLHAGISHTLSQLRQEFWVPKGRSVVRRVLNRCSPCRRFLGGPFALPDMPQWPRERVSKSSPFRYIGLDYMGPVTVKVGESTQKMWICLFTCLAVRAVHLEVVSDCSTKSFLMCLIRFVSRRGTPDRIISDNAPQFRVAKTVLDKMWQGVLSDECILTYAANHGIDWKFTLELAPWQGGFYERLVGIVKRSLRMAVGRTLLTSEQLQTVVAEVEASVNCRPITYVYGELNSGRALRPIDFLTDLPVGMPGTDGKVSSAGLGDAGRDLVAYWKYRQCRLKSLWSFWYDEYLLSLREKGGRQHRQQRGCVKSFPTVGDVILLKDSEQPRGAWKLARVKKLITSSDGVVRAAEVYLANNVTIQRSISHLYPLEIESTNDDDQLEQDQEGGFDGFTPEEVNDAELRLQQQRALTRGRNNIHGGMNNVAMSFQYP